MRAGLLVACAAALVIAAACSGERMPMGTYRSNTGADAREGRAIIETAGCGSCHMIPGVTGAEGLVGPPLIKFGRRTFIAGELPNTPENLVKWLRDPHSVEPKTAMPKIGLDDRQARAVAAYLYTLR